MLMNWPVGAWRPSAFETFDIWTRVTSVVISE